MTIRYLPRLDPERWYVITADRAKDEGRPSWQHHGVWLHGPNTMAHAEWNLLKRGSGFGLGFEFGRNGGESDVGLNLYAGRLASVWLRLRTPWTRWAQVSKDRDPKGWYNARHTGLRLFPHRGCLLAWEFDAYEGHWSSTDPKWRRWSLTATSILGRTTVETFDGDDGSCEVPLPEGIYLATWQEKRYVRRHVRWPGTWIDVVRGPRRHAMVDLDIPGGIPVEGKGENSWDCGMDGLFGCSGSTVEDAVGNAVKHVLRDRKRYGGPHNLPRPMTVQEAGTHD